MPRGKQPNWRILAVVISVTFETRLQDKGQLRFSIPKKVAQLLGLGNSKKRVWLSIKTRSNKPVYDAPKTMTSGKEITGADMKKAGLKPGQPIRVQVSRRN
jgi:hypothetical protein